MLHLVTQFGYARAFPAVSGEEPGTAIADAMDTARGGQFVETPSSYPGGSYSSTA